MMTNKYLLLLLLPFCIGIQIIQAQNSMVAKNLNFKSSDSLFSKPFIDIDEWRDKPVRHRYIHGGFEKTETRFSFYFPPKEQYQGYFFNI